EARHQARERRLARAAGSDQRHHFTRADIERYAIQLKPARRRVAERRVVERNAVAELADGVRAWFVADLLRLVEIGEDFLRGAERLLKYVVKIGDPLHRLVEEEQRGEKADERFRVENVILDFLASEPQQPDERHRTHEFDKRRGNALNQYIAQV